MIVKKYYNVPKYYEIDDVDLLNWLKENKEIISEDEYIFDHILSDYIDEENIKFEIIDEEENEIEYKSEAINFNEMIEVIKNVKDVDKFNL